MQLEYALRGYNPLQADEDFAQMQLFKTVPRKNSTVYALYQKYLNYYGIKKVKNMNSFKEYIRKNDDLNLAWVMPSSSKMSQAGVVTRGNQTPTSEIANYRTVQGVKVKQIHVLKSNRLKSVSQNRSSTPQDYSSGHYFKPSTTTQTASFQMAADSSICSVSIKQGFGDHSLMGDKQP